MRFVKLKDIIEMLDFHMDGWKQFYNKKTGKFTDVQVEYLGIAEELEDKDNLDEYMDWEQDAIKEAIEIVENWKDYIELPDEYEVNEYSIMEQFCYSIENQRLSNSLCNAISGRGAFRRFKDAIIQYDLEDSWYTYKHKALCKIARNWCEHNNIPLVEEQ